MISKFLGGLLLASLVLTGVTAYQKLQLINQVDRLTIENDSLKDTLATLQASRESNKDALGDYQSKANEATKDLQEARGELARLRSSIGEKALQKPYESGDEIRSRLQSYSIQLSEEWNSDD